MSNNTICIYHNNCADGFTSAWVVRKALGKETEFFGGTHQEPPPDVTGKDVVFVDFSYKSPVIKEMLKTAKSIFILDHHKSAAEDLLPLIQTPDGGGLTAIFNMDRSGAGITWSHYFPNVVPPKLLLHVEDRDLFRFDLPGTREIQLTVFSYEYTFDNWDKLMDTPVSELELEGRSISRKHYKDIAELSKAGLMEMEIAGTKVPVVNLPYTMATDTANILSEGKPFAACYWDTPNGRNFSLRSKEEGGVDVSAIAKQFGGGGHKHAAGFRVPFDHELARN